MQRKEINIFSTSFLDLLSGALGAVLILFIIIPKMTTEQQITLEQIEELNVQVDQLEQLIEQARNSIPVELYEQIQEQIETLQNTVSELTDQVQQLQQQLQNAESENRRLREQLEQTQQQLQETQEKLKKKDGLPSNLVDKGEVEVFILWEENVDVDLYIKNLNNGELCQHPGLTNHTGSSNPNVRTWGMLTEDINNTRLRGDGTKYYEIFYQPHPVSGRYQVYFNIFQNSDGTHWDGRPATISGFAVMYPGKPNEKRIDFPTVTLTRAMEDHIVGTLTVTNNNITLE
jgi:outer membrane murein-binding lipoprotein Lpp